MDVFQCHDCALPPVDPGPYLRAVYQIALDMRSRGERERELLLDRLVSDADDREEILALTAAVDDEITALQIAHAQAEAAAVH